VVGVDVGKWRCHWVALALRNDGGRHVLEYGQLQVPADVLGQEEALRTALREFRDGPVADGWESDDGRLAPDLVLVDSGWLTETVYGFCRESPGWFPAKGFAAQQYRRPYRAPRGKDRSVAFVGDGYHQVRLPAARVRLFDCNADHWKSQAHDGLRIPAGTAGAVTLYKAAAADHLTFGKHATAERQTREFRAGVGEVVSWETVSRNNHYLDALGIALVAAAHAAATERKRGGEDAGGVVRPPKKNPEHRMSATAPRPPTPATAPSAGATTRSCCPASRGGASPPPAGGATTAASRGSRRPPGRPPPPSRPAAAGQPAGSAAACRRP
jgi:hypothetical protein